MGARRMAIPCVERLGTVLIEDVGVPIPRIPELVAAVVAIAARHATAIPVIGHAGDGNFHPLVTFDASDPDATARAEAAFDDVMERRPRARRHGHRRARRRHPQGARTSARSSAPT